MTNEEIARDIDRQIDQLKADLARWESLKVAFARNDLEQIAGILIEIGISTFAQMAKLMGGDRDVDGEGSGGATGGAGCH